MVGSGTEGLNWCEMMRIGRTADGEPACRGNSDSWLLYTEYIFKIYFLISFASRILKKNGNTESLRKIH